MGTGEKEIPYIGSREPSWDEMTDAQKIERLRYIIREVQAQANKIGDMVFNLAKHRHLNDGRLCTEIPESGQETYGNPFHRFAADKRYL